MERTDVDLGHGNVISPSFDGTGLGQPRHGVLGARVRRRVGSRDMRSERAVVNDSACRGNGVRDIRGKNGWGYRIAYLLWVSAT